jgi:HJR/Mrr/RecB family endonuclease
MPKDSKDTDLASTTLQTVMGAGKSIALKARYPDGREFGLHIEDLAYSVDKRLSLRCLLPLPGIHRERDGTLYKSNDSTTQEFNELKHSLRLLEDAGWYIRLIPDRPLVSSLSGDDDAVIYYEYLNDKPGPIFSTQRRDIKHYIDQFEAHWNHSFDTSAIESLYEQVKPFAQAQESIQIAVVSFEAWTRIIAQLSESPELLHKLPPRKFEELIAELLHRDGLEVHLTPQSRDGGRDILAFQRTTVGKHLYLVECKRHGPANPVGVSIVQRLYGVVTQERATAGLIVTTSRFTKDALSFAGTVQHQLGLKDYEALKAWLKAHLP